MVADEALWYGGDDVEDQNRNRRQNSNTQDTTQPPNNEQHDNVTLTVVTKLWEMQLLQNEPWSRNRQHSDQ